MLEWADIDEADLQSILDEEDNVKTRIIFAREELKVLASAICARYLLPFAGGGFVPYLVCLRKRLVDWETRECACRVSAVAALLSRPSTFLTSPPLCLSQQLQLSKDQIKYLCEEASRAQTQGQRAEIFACEVARASAGGLLINCLSLYLVVFWQHDAVHRSS